MNTIFKTHIWSNPAYWNWQPKSMPLKGLCCLAAAYLLSLSLLQFWDTGIIITISKNITKLRQISKTSGLLSLEYISLPTLIRHTTNLFYHTPLDKLLTLSGPLFSQLEDSGIRWDQCKSVGCPMFWRFCKFLFLFCRCSDIRLLLSSVSPGIHMENKTSANRKSVLIWTWSPKFNCLSLKYISSKGPHGLMLIHVKY